MFRAVVFSFASLFACAACAQAPGDKLPAEKQAKLGEVRAQLQAAMDAKDEQAVYAAVARARAVLGSYAGVPESPEEYARPIDARLPDMDSVGRQVHETLMQLLPHAGSRSEIGQKNQMELRDPAYFAVACIAMAKSGAPNAAEYVARAREELDYLLERQYQTGMFPYPADAGPNAPAHVRAMVEQFLQEHPDSVWNGYVIITDGGNQFDTGCCAYAMVQGYMLTREEKYLESAKRAAAWSLQQGLSTNWNYNAFSVWFLAALYGVTHEARLLEGAVEKALLGVLPGLMENGRWVDQHNAKLSYHYIMVRALSELLRVMPKDEPRYEEIKTKTAMAAEARAREILESGPANIESTLWGLVSYLTVLGPNDVCRNAANTIVNAMAARGTFNPIATPLYIQYMIEQPSAPGPRRLP